MRRHTPRQSLIVLGLALLAILAFMDFQGRFFLKGLKTRSLDLIKQKIGLDGNIGSVEGGIFRGIILRDVRLYGTFSPEEKKVFFSSEAIGLGYRLWDIALGRYDKLDRITFVSPKLYFFGPGERFLVPKVFEPAWKEITVSIKDGSFCNAQGISVVNELNGNFRLSEHGIESQSVNANILGQRFVGKGMLGFPIEKSAVRLESAIRGNGYALKARLDGTLDKIFVNGSFDMFDKLNLNFSGNIAAGEKALTFNNFRFGPKFILNGLIQTAKDGFNIDVYPEDTSGNATAMGELSRLGISGDLSKLPYFTLSINANHLKLLELDLMSNCIINGKLNYGANNRVDSVTGDFSTSGSVINYDPIRELKGAYEIKDGKVKLLGVSYGDTIFASGYTSFDGKKDTELHFRFKGAQLAGLMDLTTEKGTVSGLVFGEINIRNKSGNDMNIDGQLEFLNGNISVVRYNSAKLNIRGKGSILEFVDSKVYTEGEVLTLEGRIDIGDIGTPRVFRNIAIKSDPNTVVWAGVNVIRTANGDEYFTGKNLNDQFRVNFRTYESQDSEQRSPGQDEMELEYKLGRPGNLKLKMKENEDFFGLEQKVRF